MLNVPLILKLAAFIETGSMPYNQRHWTSCIAGQCCHMKGIRASHDAGELAQRWLGLDETQYRQLFHGNPLLTATGPTRDVAARVLRHLAATGKTDWHVKEDPIPEATKEAVALSAMLTNALQATPKAKAAQRRELADA